ncbi:MAG: hypothetical protein IKQ18_06555, partial [Clostridia bacterium]|nr:hypothetical protein [Clostridia bacterium]
MKKLLSLLLVICMLLACAASVAAVTAAKTPTDAKKLTFTDSVTSYLSNANSATYSVVSDDTESGCSILLQPKAPYTDPFVFFNFKNYVNSLGLSASAPTANNVKYVVFKVRQELCANNMFEIFYCTSGGVGGATAGYSVTAVFELGLDDWQYVIFNMEGRKGWSGTITGFRIDWMQNGSSSNEKMYINEIILAKDDAELQTYTKPAESTGEDLHALTEDQQKLAEYLLNNAVETAPAVSNEKVNAEYEDESLVMWFDHSYYKTPGETVTSNGQNTYQMRLAKNEIEC